MTSRLTISTDANCDIAGIVEWYDKREPDIGNEFIATVERRLEAICRDPAMFRVTGTTVVRKAPVGNFPYRIYYRLIGDEVNVIAIIHTSRDPAYISSRLR